MTTTTANKRLDEIETNLTPKEWAIWFAADFRKYPDPVAYMRAQANLSLDELPALRPCPAFEKQAADRHPGDKPENIRARHRLNDALWKEYHTLKLLMRDIEMAMRRKAEILGLQAALQFSALHGIILREALDGYPSSLDEWRREHAALLQDFYTARAAVEQIKQEQFDGQPFLLMDMETKLNEMARIFESADATARDYLKHRAERDGTDTDEAANKPANSLQSIKASAAGQCAAVIAGKWLREASHEAIKDSGERWEQSREEYLAKE